MSTANEIVASRIISIEEKGDVETVSLEVKVWLVTVVEFELMVDD